jgi:predicted transcriptional regulator
MRRLRMDVVLRQTLTVLPSCATTCSSTWAWALRMRSAERCSKTGSRPRRPPPPCRSWWPTAAPSPRHDRRPVQPQLAERVRAPSCDQWRRPSRFRTQRQHHTVAPGDLPAGGCTASLYPRERPSIRANVPRTGACRAGTSFVQDDHLVCLVCGKRHRSLRRHLDVAHQLTSAAYCELFGLKRNYPMAAPGYARQRSEMAKRLGLGRRKQAPTRPRKTRSGG